MTRVPEVRERQTGEMAADWVRRNGATFFQSHQPRAPQVPADESRLNPSFAGSQPMVVMPSFTMLTNGPTTTRLSLPPSIPENACAGGTGQFCGSLSVPVMSIDWLR